MPIGVSNEHEDLRRAVRRWAEVYCPPSVPRACLTLPGEAPVGDLVGGAGEDHVVPPTPWDELRAQGWLGLHVAEEYGGQGFGLPELVVVLEELGRALLPGPLLPTVVTSAALELAGSDEARAELLPGIAAGDTPAAVFLGSAVLRHDQDGSSGGLEVSGELHPVLGGPTARWLLAPLGDKRWCVLDVHGPGVVVTPVLALDQTRPLARVHVDAARVPAHRVLGTLDSATVRELAVVMAAAESAGGARWCVDTASQYATQRVQFGRPIGQFQAVKHRLADMLVTVEQADAVVWDAAAAWGPELVGVDPGAQEHRPRRLAAAVAGSVVPDGFAECAKGCVQILGGIGFTWEHDAHLYLRRAMATRQLLGEPARWREQVAAEALNGVRRPLVAELPDEAEGVREEMAALVAEAAALSGDEQRRFLVDSGLLAPHWPKPWGRDASPLEQLVIDEELTAAGIHRPGLAVGAWALPTLIAHGTAAQQERWVRPTMLGEITWCQLFSEPGAGSDLAGLSTRAERVEGGWRLTGQKVWTSMAQVADWGICLARTDPEAPKHAGITYFLVDMKSDGVDVRPLRELTGDAMFNEVFLTDVFVPDDCVVGAPGEGWAIGRTTLTNERVSLSSGATFGIGVESVLRRLGELGATAPPAATVDVGGLLAEAQSIQLLGQRTTLRSLSGLEPGAGSSVRKLLGAEHEQRVQEMGLAFQGAEGATMEGRAERWGRGFLVTRCLTIAGGTSEVQRNVLAERILGQPRDPEPGA
ncbi:MAG: acyl-CoA dehydrogenase [Actinomycetota bacterium]|nr:acyl-CoA dehydrogenase [Actinomycetota bacterium]